MAGKIFINYRRDDSIGTAGRLHDRLAQAFGRKNLFMDVDHIPAGVDFVSYLNSQVAVCNVFLAVIGPHWLDAKDESGNRRLDNPEDFVSVEIAAALARDIRVIPVLVDGAQVPKAADLPDSLKPLVRRNAVEVRNAQFGRDAEALIKKVREAFKDERSKLSEWRIVAIGTAALLLLAGWIGLYQMSIPVWVPWRAPSESARQAGSDVAREAKEEATHKAQEAARLKAQAEATREAKEEADRKAQEEAARKAQEEAARKAQEEAAREAQEEAARKRKEEARRDPALAVTPGSGRSFRDVLANGQPCPMCPEMVVVPSGSFIMGSPESEPERLSEEGPQITVRFRSPIAVGIFAITRAQFASFVSETGHKTEDDCETIDSRLKVRIGGSWQSPGIEQDDRHPVVCVSWNDAQAYATWLAVKTGRPYRLLSEAEREYVTRAGTTTPFWWGATIMSTDANYGRNRWGTVRVDSFKPNPWGLYNVHGNVWEWTDDCTSASHRGNPGDGGTRPTGADCKKRMMRGGAWSSVARALRSSFRTAGGLPDARSDMYGFRLGRALIPQF